MPTNKKDFRRSLFLETYKDLRQRIVPKATPYNVLRMCLLLRQLIGKEDNLAEMVADEHSLDKPIYRYRSITIPQQVLNILEFGLIASGIDPNVSSAAETSETATYTGPIAGGKTKPGNQIDLSWPNWIMNELYDQNVNPIIEEPGRIYYETGIAAFANQRQIKINELIGYLAYNMGGIHEVLDTPDKPAREAVEHLFNIGFVSYKEGVTDFKKSDILSTLQVIGLITIRGLTPLFETLKDNPSSFIISA